MIVIKVGVSSYSFSKCMKNGMSLSEVIRTAKEMGFDCIEFAHPPLPEGVGEAAYAAEIKRMCGDTGIEAVSYAVYADFLNNSGGDMAKEADRVKGCVDAAAALGVKKMRHDVTYGYKNRASDYKEVIDKVAPYVRSVTEYAESLGIKTMTENHGYFLQDSYRMEYLVRAVGHPNFGVLIDIGNFMCADEDPLSAVSRLAPFVFHVHAKDFLFKNGLGCKPDEHWFPTRSGNFLRGTVTGHGVVPVAQCLKALINAGYDDTLGLEFEGMEEPLPAIKAGLNFLRGALS